MSTTARLITSTHPDASAFPVLAIEKEGELSDAAGAAGDAAQAVAAIRAVLGRYEAALNASDTGAVLALYDEDGVFMPAFSPPAVGLPAIRAAYEAVFRAIRLAVTLQVDEIVRVAPGWAFARTRSAGTVTVHATGGRAAEGNQELFVFHRGADAAWRIARYAFSPTARPPA
jgi:uncharacterized protein (TIGR02246 family)